MRIGLAGLGRMGANIGRRLRRAGIEVLAQNRNADVTRALAAECGVGVAPDLAALAAGLATPRCIWLMLPAGEVTANAIDTLLPLLAPGDLIVDGANSWYKDSLRHAERCAAAGVEFVDAGVSGGVWGLENGYALMLGGSAAAIARLRPVIESLAPAPDRGWLHCGAAGSGHFVKMVHNGIEYGMMQAYAEGFALLRARGDFALDLAAVAETWRHGSVVRSWLLDLCADALGRDATLAGIAPVVADSGEGRWTAQEGIELGVPLPVISLALMARFDSQGKADYAARLLAQMRNAFGGHALIANPPAPP